MADENLEVDPQKIASYANNMQLEGPTSAMSASIPTFQMSPTANSAFSGLAGGGGTMPEAAQIVFSVKDLAGRYQQFLGDVGRGLTAIGNAAMVCALTYNNTDATSAEELGLVNFAFQEPGSGQRPEGLPKDVGDETLWDQEVARGSAPGTPASVTGEGGTTIYVGAGSITMYPDRSGESRFPGPMINGQPSTVTTLTGPGGVVLQTSTVAGSGANKTQIVTMPGVGGGPPSTVTTRTTVVGDKVTVTTTKKGPQVDPKTGTVTEVEQPPVVQTYDKSDITEAPERGPLQELYEDTNTEGTVVDWRKADQGAARREATG